MEAQHCFSKLGLWPNQSWHPPRIWSSALITGHKDSLAYNVSFWGQKLQHFVSFWVQKYCWTIFTISCPRNSNFLSVSVSRNITFLSVSGLWKQNKNEQFKQDLPAIGGREARNLTVFTRSDLWLCVVMEEVTVTMFKDYLIVTNTFHMSVCAGWPCLWVLAFCAWCWHAIQLRRRKKG